MKANTVRKIIKKAINGDQLTGEEIARLLSVPLLSEESFYLQHAARKMSGKASGGLAEIHAQVGLNSGPCPKNCAFCSFAASNGIFREHHELETDEIIKKCLDFENEGANAIYLMSTAAFDFVKYLKTAKEVRKCLQPETVMVANTGDFDYHQAVALKEAGFAGVYHAVRLGEGRITALSVSRRMKTFSAASKAGLLVGTCVEPVGPEHSVEEIVERTLLTRKLQPVYSGAARRITIPGTDLSKKGMISEAKMAHILAVVRLAMGYGCVGNCTHEPNVIGAASGANLFWAEAGSNPRDDRNNTEAGRGFSVAKCKVMFREAEWRILKGPSVMFGSQLSSLEVLPRRGGETKC